jgi:hypothetical protein
MKTIKIFLSAILLVAASAITHAQTVTIPVDSIPPAFKTSLNKMLDGYMRIENALMKGNPSEAGAAASELDKITATVNVTGLTAAQLKTFKKQAEKIQHNAQHIRDNATDYDHQCEHFDYLTDSFYSLLKYFRFNTTTFYYNYTADGNAGNSAHWLTDKSTLENPYFKGAKRQVGDKQVAVLQPKS